MPTAGSIDSLKIFSGVFAATSSMSMPPSVLAMIERAADGAVKQHGQVKFLFDIGAAGDEQLAARAGHPAPVCLVTSTLPSIFARQGNRFVRRGRRFDAALKTALEQAFAAATGVDLGFDAPPSRCRRPGFFRPHCGPLRAIGRGSPAGRRRHVGRAIVWPDIRECSCPDKNLPH